MNLKTYKKTIKKNILFKIKWCLLKQPPCTIVIISVVILLNIIYNLYISFVLLLTMHIGVFQLTVIY